jgi:AcrR family transcriptional regulator
MKQSIQTKRKSKKEQVVGAAETLFSRHGSRRVTVEEICRQARVSKMTFYKYFSNKKALVRHLRDMYVAEGFRKFDEIKALDIPFAEKIDCMTQWKVEFGSRINAEFIREMVSIDHVRADLKHRFLNNLVDARNNGEIRDDIDPEFLWLVTEKLSELVKDGTWKAVFNDFSQYQYQSRTLIFYGLLSRKEAEKC